MNSLRRMFKRLKMTDDSQRMENLLWNQASMLDALALIHENAHLGNELEKSRYQSLANELHELRQTVDRQFAQTSESPENRAVRDEDKNALDPTPKRLEFALASHLIAVQCNNSGPGKTNVVDLGAHRGVFTRMAREVGACVWALEPNPSLFGELSAKFSDDDSVTSLPFAASDKSETSDLFLVETEAPDPSNLDLTLFSSLRPHPMPAPFTFSSKVAVESRTLDSMIEEQILPDNFFFLKIDTEGSEEQIIDGLSLASPAIICLEYWGDDLGFRNSDSSPVSATIQKLEKRGYSNYLTVFQTTEASWPSWEKGFSNQPRSYGNLFFFQDSHYHSMACDWCHQLLDAETLSRRS